MMMMMYIGISAFMVYSRSRIVIDDNDDENDDYDDDDVPLSLLIFLYMSSIFFCVAFMLKPN